MTHSGEGQNALQLALERAVEEGVEEVITPERLRQDTSAGGFWEAPGAQQRMSPVNGRGRVECLEPQPEPHPSKMALRQQSERRGQLADASRNGECPRYLLPSTFLLASLDAAGKVECPRFGSAELEQSEH